VAGAACYVDLPPRDPGAAAAEIAMVAVDGAFDASSEGVAALVDTAGFGPGRHIAFVQGWDADGNRGAVSAAFFHVADGTEGRVVGKVTDGGSGQPLEATVWADALGLGVRTDPSTGNFALVLPAGEWNLRAAAARHLHDSVDAVPVEPNGVTEQDFSPAPAPGTLVVDDDDNDPNVLGYHTAALDLLGESYAVWDTHNSDHEPSVLDLEPYRNVLWFSGAERGGSAGPAGPGSTALEQWLQGGGCLLLASQDHFGDRGLTAFMQERLGVAQVNEDARHTSVTGQGEPFGGLGPYSLDFPYTNRSDGLTPDATATTAFVGSAGGAATAKDGRYWRATYWGFGVETLPTAADRQAALGAFLDWCGAMEVADADWDGWANEADCSPGDPAVWAAPTPARELRLGPAGPDNLSWTPPLAPGAAQLSYDVLRSTDAREFHTAGCVASGLSGTAATDLAEPPAGTIFYYLVRAGNDCGESLGPDSTSTPRWAPPCY